MMYVQITPWVYVRYIGWATCATISPSTSRMMRSNRRMRLSSGPTRGSLCLSGKESQQSPESCNCDHIDDTKNVFFDTSQVFDEDAMIRMWTRWEIWPRTKKTFSPSLQIPRRHPPGPSEVPAISWETSPLLGFSISWHLHPRSCWADVRAQKRDMLKGQLRLRC